MKTKTQSFGKPLCRVMMAVAIMLLSLQAMAYDFSYTYQGKTLYYTILPGTTNKVAVVYYSETPASNNHVSGDVVIPSSVEHNNVTYSVTYISNYAFRGCSGLTSVSIPNSVTFIGAWAFYGCSSLTSVTIPNSVTSIGDETFNGCNGLTSVSIPNSVTLIGRWAFYDCSGLTSVAIPNSVRYIGVGAFRGCSGLTSINVASGNTHYSSIDGVLYNYVQDTLIQCPGARTSLTIPNSVTFIGDGAFYRCRDLTSIKCLASIPPSIGDNSFQNISDTCLLTVPCGSLEAYTTSDWNTYFASRISEDLSFELSVSANDETYGRVAFEAQSCEVATITATPNEGYEFTGWSDGNTENPRTVTITSDTTFMAIFSPASSLQEVNAREFALYPNPAKSFVNLEFEALKENTLLQILDLNGRKVRTFDLKAGVELLKIDLGDLPKGVYAIKFGNAIRKLVVE